MKYQIKSLALIMLLSLFALIAGAQVGIDNPTPNPNSSLDLGATDKGLLLNRMTTNQRTSVLEPSLTAAERGMVVFDTDLEQVFLWDGSDWTIISSGGLSGSGVEGELTMWGPSDVLSSDTNLFWDDTYNRLGIGTKFPTAALSIHNDADIALDIKNSGNYGISEHLVGIERTIIPIATTDVLNLKVPSGSPSNIQFLECEYGTSKVLSINGDGHINATSLGFGTDDNSARLDISGGSWDVKMNVVGTSNPSVIPHMINFEKTVTPYAGTTLLKLKQPSDSPETAYFLEIEDGATDKLVIEGDGDLIAKGGADLVTESGYIEVRDGAGEDRIRMAASTSGSYTNFYNIDENRTIYLRSGTTSGSSGGELSLYTSGEIETVSLDGNDGSGARMTMRDDGGTTSITIDADHLGSGDSRIIVDELELVGGSDFAEMFDVREMKDPTDKILPGMVVAIDPERPGKLKVCDEEFDKKVAGIISGAGGVKPGLMMGDDRTLASGDYPVALSGRVYVKATEKNGEINPGDFLTTSALPGYAMKVKDVEKASGSIIGKAMTPVNEEGLVLVLVSLQ